MSPNATRSREEKYDERRTQLAISALATLGELGYARTSLREIAQNSEFTHGVVHYYFKDKIDLITFCVRYYKTQCATRYDEITETSTSAEELRERFADKLVETMVEESSMHRLWYDLRTQGMFEARLRTDILAIDETLETMIWRIVARYAELGGTSPALTSTTSYAVLDGLFEKALLRHLGGDVRARDFLREQARVLLPMLVTPT